MKHDIFKKIIKYLHIHLKHSEGKSITSVFIVLNLFYAVICWLNTGNVFRDVPVN